LSGNTKQLPSIHNQCGFVDYSPSTKFLHAVLSKEYSRLGMGSKSIALNSIKVSVQNAISDFIKINHMTSDKGKEG
jgi:hypothetical protein